MKKMEFKHDPKNAKIHTDRNKSVISNSLREIGAFRSIAVDGDGIIRAGNGVYEQAQALGMKTKIVDTDAETLIVVRRKDLTGEKAVKAALYDNRSGELGEWDLGALAEIKNDFSLDVFEGIFELDEINLETDFDFGESPETVKQNIEHLAEIKDARKNGNENTVSKTDSEKYLVIVFPSREAKEKKLDELGLPIDERYLASSQVTLKMNMRINKKFDGISQKKETSGTTGGVCKKRKKREN